MNELFKAHPELEKAWEMLKPYCAQVECIEGSSFQGGDEECFTKGIGRRPGRCFVFSPDAVPYKKEDDEP